ncbi:MAG: histidinol dehydrogenase, partial [Boseongicola sp. SB0662_bin_57]|nr:histidinol dehydrogenase [Boseongicola sp. SB0662_bin_57]
MTREYLKKATLTSTSDAADVRDTVQGMLDAIRAGGDTTAMEFAAKFDRYDGNVIVTPAEIEAACAAVPGRLKDDIRFAHDNVRRFAEAQKDTLQDME